MSLSQQSKCLFCSFTRFAQKNATIRRQLHSSASRFERRRSNARQSQPSKGGVSMRREAVKDLPQEEIQRNFSPQQAEAIRQAQDSQSSEYKSRTAPKATPWSLDYFDDFTQIDPVVDKPVKSPWTNLDDSIRLKTEDELSEDIYKFMENIPEDDDAAEDAWAEFEKSLRLTVGKEEAERSPRSASAPDIPKTKEQRTTKTKGSKPSKSDDQQSEVSPALVRLMQMTGYNQQQLRNIRVKSIVSHRVVNQTRLGKIGRQYFLSIAGNGNGLIGIGEGKSDEPTEGKIQSQYRAIRNMQPIMRYESRTIFGDVKGKSGATELELFTRPPGFGLRCQHNIWEIAKCAGISDLAARVTRARNPMNTVKATVQALLSQKDPEDIARARGKKLVDVRKVYYAGNV